MQYQFEKTESTASTLYIAKAIDDEGNVVMQWQIACDDESQLQTIAEEAYAQAAAPKTY